MSRSTVKEFLQDAKSQLSAGVRGRQSFVIGNESADLDSIICAVVYAYLASGNIESHVVPVTNMDASGLALRPELTVLLKSAGVDPEDLITLDDCKKAQLQPEGTRWTLVDHNKFHSKLGSGYDDCVVGLIDHHELEIEPEKLKSYKPCVHQITGSCSSLVVNWYLDDVAPQYRGGSKLNNAHIASLALGPILIDTINMTDRTKVRDHDEKAVERLEAVIKHHDPAFDRTTFYNEIAEAKSNLDGLSLAQILEKDYKSWPVGKSVLGTAVAVQPLEYLLKKGNDFNDVIWKFAEDKSLTLFVLMTAFEEDGNLVRQVLLLSNNSDEANAMARKFIKDNESELQLQKLELPGLQEETRSPVRGVYMQKNLAHSRKKVAPMLRAAMAHPES